ncbi:MAG: hypothetical protein ACRD2C_23130 [Acidimicrobiales bacterium]
MALDPLDTGVFGKFQWPPGRGHANAGVIVDPDGITLVDTLMTPDQWEPFAAEVDEIGLPVRRVVLTSSSVEFAGGTGRFKLAAIYGSPQASVHLDQPPNVESWQVLYPEQAAGFADVATRPVSHVVADDAQVTESTSVFPSSGQMDENLVVLVEGAHMLFAGAMCSFGVTPLCWQGDPRRWADELDRLAEMAPIIVPGHGSIGGIEDLRDQQAYLRACAGARGDRGALPSGPWDLWSDREHDVVNVERAAMLAEGDTGVPPSMLRLAGLA